MKYIVKKPQSICSYADDTNSSFSGKSMEDVKGHLEEDAEEILKFMVSNGPVANPSKATLPKMNQKE